MDTEFLLSLPVSLEPERARYEREIAEAREKVAAWFEEAGFPVDPSDILAQAVVFENVAAARAFLEVEFGVAPEEIPDTFSGTVRERTLFLVSRGTYRAIWRDLYPDWAWDRNTYRDLITHELAHRAHETATVARFGTAEAMGPTWFFEGLAIACAGQFDDHTALSRRDLESWFGGERAIPVSYPLYGRLVRSLLRQFEQGELIERAADPGFPGVLFTRQ